MVEVMPVYIILALLAVGAVLLLRIERTRRFLLPDDQPSRFVTGLSAAVLAALGYICTQLLVFDSGDNAYLGLLLLGMLSYLIAVPFALATVFPKDSARRIIVLIAVGALLVGAGMSVFFLIWALAIIPSQDYGDSDVFVAHLIALLSLLSACAAIITGHRLLRAR